MPTDAAKQNALELSAGVDVVEDDVASDLTDREKVCFSYSCHERIPYCATLDTFSVDACGREGSAAERGHETPLPRLLGLISKHIAFALWIRQRHADQCTSCKGGQCQRGDAPDCEQGS